MPNIVKSKVTNCDLEGNCADRIASVKQQIFVVRQQRVMLDHDLARLYGVTTKQLNQQLKRNHHRFPPDFAFRLTLREAKQITSSRLQNATLKKGQNIKYAPHVFTEHGRFKAVFEAIRQLILTPARPQRPIGFISASSRAKKGGKK
jgi:hypothetical protein